MANRIPQAMALLATLGLLSGPASAQGTAPADLGNAPAQASRQERDGAVLVERRISELHRRLKINPEQQPQWDAFTAVMRQNATHMQALERDRADKVMAMAAPDDMRSYADVARAHADDLQHLVPAFDALYAAMTPEQKAMADRIFHDFQGRNGRPRTRP